CMQGIELPYSC
nr:immunoglobulin light chain junction region [Macaca mulatta]MOW74433.1 immunoglobulin light chain junction region [Macaca mulatta]MOW74473.1 immunoglobulin light chain junction region [Macaca mulatta]MOW74965.1 immunoglobulin light chain junction region [Macaca mulatta]